MNHVSRIIHFVFIFCVPFQARLMLFHATAPFNEWTAGFLWGSDILLAALVILNFKFLILKKSDVVLFIFLGIALFTIHYALIPQIAWYRFFKLAEYIALYFYFRNSKFPIAWPIAISAGFQAVIGILQYMFQHSLGLWFLGESPLRIGMSGIATVVANGHEYLRAYGTTPHPNVLAVWLLLGLWAAGVLRKKFLLALIAICLLLTFSRVAIAVAVLGAIVAWVPAFHVAFLSPLRFRFQIAFTDEAIAQRLFYLREAWALAIAHPWGVGIGQFVPMLMERLPIYPDFIYQPAHNIFLLVLAEMGILGLLAFLLVLFFSARKYLFLLVCLVILGSFDHYFWTLQQGGLIFWGLLGYLARDKIMTDDKSSNSLPDRV